MLDRIADFITTHGMFDAGQRVGVAVSGGADSVFLLHVLRELGARWDLHISVIHIEHGIRHPASLADAEFVRQMAATWGVPFHIRHADVPAMEGNLEEAARNVRDRFYVELMQSGVVERIATGHTRSDQAETVLYRILRGAGLTGLSGILPATRGGLVRPLLKTDRSEIELWLRERRIPWREDETNRDRTFARNRLRHEILPLLRESFNPQVDDALAHLATLARDEEDYWETQLDSRFPPDTRSSHQPLIISTSQLTGARLTGAPLTGAPLALARRLVRRSMEVVKGDLRGIEFTHVERVIEMARSRGGHDRFQVPGLDICRSFDLIRLAPAGVAWNENRDFSFVVPVPGGVELPGSGTRITLQVFEKKEATSPCATVVDELDWQRFSTCRDAPSLELRNWRPGDQYRRVGQSKAEKIKVFFQDERIPLWERGHWPIITYNEAIVWARRFGAAAEFATSPQTRSVLQVAESAK